MSSVSARPGSSAPADASATEPSRTRREYLFPGVVALTLVAKAVLTRALALGDTRILMGTVLEAAIIVTLVVGSGLLIWRWRFWAYCGIATLLSLSMLATALYALHFERIATPQTLRLAPQLVGIGASVIALLGPAHLLYVIDLPLLGIWAAREQRTAEALPRPAVLGGVFGAAAVFSVSAVVAAAGLPAPLDDVLTSRFRGLLVYQLASTFRHEDVAAATARSLGSAAQIQARIAAVRGSSDETTTPLPSKLDADTNLILVQVEALQTGVIGRTIRGRQITPNLNRFAETSHYFPNMYSQFGRGNTSDIEYVVNSSLYPPPVKTVAVSYADKQITGLPRLMRAAGYEAVAFHANTGSYWNRQEVYPSLGFQRFCDKRFFGDEDTIGLGPSDAVLYREAVKEFSRIRATGKPFYAQLVTLTSHHPFSPLPPWVDPYEPPPPYEGTFVGRYISHINYADRAFGAFMADLRRTGLYGNSVIVVYGDHFGLRDLDTSDGEQAAARALFGRRYSNVDRLRVPLMIHVPGQVDGATYRRPLGQVDVMPTLAALFGLDLSDTPHFGVNAFGNGPTIIPIPSYAGAGSFVADEALVLPGSGDAGSRAFGLDSGKPVAVPAGSARDAQRVAELIALSAAYLESLPDRPGARRKAAFIPSQGLVFED